jgi:hypothetical protein
MSLSSQFDPFHEYEGIEFEHHGAGWRSDPDRFEDVPGGGVPSGFGAFGDVPFTHGMIHLPGGKRIAVEGTWNKLQTPAAGAQPGQSTVQQHGGVEQAFGPREVPERTWDDFRFHALAEVEDAYDAPLMDIGVQSVVGPAGAPERPEGGGTLLSRKPVGVHLPEGVGTPAGYYPVEVGPTHSKVHTEGWWRELDHPGFPPGVVNRDIKEVRRWAQDPGGESQGPGAPEFGTTVTEQVRRGNLQGYRRGSRRLAQQSVGVSPLEQLTDPAGPATLSSTTGDFYDFYTAELDRYMHHLRGGSGDDYFERGTHGQDMPEEPSVEADNIEDVMEQRKADPETVEFLRQQKDQRVGRASTKDTRPDESLGEPELTEEQKRADLKEYQHNRDKRVMRERREAREAKEAKAAKKVERETRVKEAVRRASNAKRREQRAAKKQPG